MVGSSVFLIFHCVLLIFVSVLPLRRHHPGRCGDRDHWHGDDVRPLQSIHARLHRRLSFRGSSASLSARRRMRMAVTTQLQSSEPVSLNRGSFEIFVFRFVLESSECAFKVFALVICSGECSFC